jgi:muramoyltetrapeptide carboxypeptidase
MVPAKVARKRGRSLAGERKRIAVVAPSCRLSEATPARVAAVAADLYGADAPDVVFHPQCFLSEGHFAGPDHVRADALVEVANDPSFDAVWFGRGGYGSGRLIEAVLPRLKQAAREKAYLGYSDGGALLSALYGQGFAHAAHGPMPQDVARDGGEAAVARALSWLVERAPAALEPSVAAGVKTAAFNMAILSSLIGTPFLPDLSGHVLMLEEVSEHMYRIDRFLFHITSSPAIRRVAGLRLGRCSLVPENDPDFVRDEEAIAKEWCARSGIAYLGRADIGHDADNRVVPFGSP